MVLYTEQFLEIGAESRVNSSYSANSIEDQNESEMEKVKEKFEQY